jgi:hypothetical protein
METTMIKRKVLTIVSMAGMLFASVAFSQGVIDGARNPYHVPGEKLDSGLGYQVAGEKLDSGLGSLTRKDMEKWLQVTPTSAGYHVPGEKLDSGLGSLTRKDMEKWLQVTRTSTASR